MPKFNGIYFNCSTNHSLFCNVFNFAIMLFMHCNGLPVDYYNLFIPFAFLFEIIN